MRAVCVRHALRERDFILVGSFLRALSFSRRERRINLYRARGSGRRRAEGVKNSTVTRGERFYRGDREVICVLNRQSPVIARAAFVYIRGAETTTRHRGIFAVYARKSRLTGAITRAAPGSGSKGKKRKRPG